MSSQFKSGQIWSEQDRSKSGQLHDISRQVRSNQVGCCHGKSAPVRSLSNNVRSGYTKSGQGHVLSGKVKVKLTSISSGQGQDMSVKVMTSQVRSDQVRFDQGQSRQVRLSHVLVRSDLNRSR